MLCANKETAWREFWTLSGSQNRKTTFLFRTPRPIHMQKTSSQPFTWVTTHWVSNLTRVGPGHGSVSWNPYLVFWPGVDCREPVIQSNLIYLYICSPSSTIRPRPIANQYTNKPMTDYSDVAYMRYTRTGVWSSGWWVKNSHKKPNCCKLVKQILIGLIPASSAESDRHFSTAGRPANSSTSWASLGGKSP